MSARLHGSGALRAELIGALISVAALLGCGDSGNSGEDARPTARDGGRPTSRAPAAPTRPQASHPPGITREAVLRRLRGRRVAVGDRRVALDHGTLTCVGLGRPGRAGRAPTWSRFRCVQPTFPPGTVVGPDIVFFVEPRRGRAMRVSGARLTRY
jgi:hypothetical protein